MVVRSFLMMVRPVLFLVIFITAAMAGNAILRAQSSSDLASKETKSSPSATKPVEASKRETKVADSGVRSLVIVRTVEAPSEPAQIFARPLRCDGDGNLYLSLGWGKVRLIRKLDSTGKRTALFDVAAAQADVKPQVTGDFAVAPDGEVFQYVFAENDINRYIFAYGSDGKLKSKIKTQPGFPWGPAQLAAFPSGQFLVTGQKLRKDMSVPMPPFTGILAADGSLLKEISLEDDEDLTKKVAAHDLSVSSSANPTSNRAISFGVMESGSDGNVYTMRWASPAIIYVINAGGEVVRRFTVEPGRPGYMPHSMHVAKRRIAVMFRAENQPTLMKVTDLEGKEVATYEEVSSEGKRPLGGAFACYVDDPEQFTFLTTLKEGLGIMLVQPQ
jgi:hypothetical protein